MLHIFSRSKNTVNILIKNWLDMCIGAVVYWAFGFGLTFGTDQGRFIGTTYFFFHYSKNPFLFPAPQVLTGVSKATDNLVRGNAAGRQQAMLRVVYYNIIITKEYLMLTVLFRVASLVAFPKMKMYAVSVEVSVERERERDEKSKSLYNKAY